MTRLSGIVAVSVVAMSLASSPVYADHPVEVTMLVESFDGCGCLDPFADPFSCPACPAEVTDGGYSDCDVFGPGSIHYRWKNSGWPADMWGDSGVVSQGYRSQALAIGSLTNVNCPNPSSVAFGSWDHVWIDYDNAACKTCSTCTTGAQRFEFEQARVAQGLPVPATPSAGHFVIAVRRADVPGTGDTSDVTTKVWVALSGLYPLGSSATSVFVNVLPVATGTPGTEGWQDVTVATLPQFITRGKIGVLVDLGPQGNSVDCSKGERVTVWVDNLRYVYTAMVPDHETNCSDGLDDDYDQLVDCDDVEDCNGNAACACNGVVAFDTDFDGDVDQADFAVMQFCMTGPGPNNPLFDALSEQCKCLDRAGTGGQADHAIDQSDLTAFERCASGSGVLASITCDD
jgi:hypothetical protein